MLTVDPENTDLFTEGIFLIAGRFLTYGKLNTPFRLRETILP